MMGACQVSYEETEKGGNKIATMSKDDTSTRLCHWITQGHLLGILFTSPAVPALPTFCHLYFDHAIRQEMEGAQTTFLCVASSYQVLGRNVDLP